MPPKPGAETPPPVQLTQGEHSFVVVVVVVVDVHLLIFMNKH